MHIKDDKFIAIITARKIELDDDLEDLKLANNVSPCCGKVWWYWVPEFRKTSIGFDISFFCFIIAYCDHDIPRKKREEQQNAVQEQ